MQPGEKRSARQTAGEFGGPLAERLPFDKPTREICRRKVFEDLKLLNLRSSSLRRNLLRCDLFSYKRGNVCCCQFARPAGQRGPQMKRIGGVLEGRVLELSDPLGKLGRFYVVSFRGRVDMALQRIESDTRFATQRRRHRQQVL